MSTSAPTTTDRRKSRVTAWLLGTFLFVFTVALAAALTITVSDVTVGGVDQGAAPCDTSVTASLGAPVWDDTAGDWVIDKVNVGDIAAGCIGDTVYVQAVDVNDEAVGSTAEKVITASGENVTLSPAVAANSVTGAAVAIR